MPRRPPPGFGVTAFVRLRFRGDQAAPDMLRDVIARVTQSAKLAAVGQRDWIIEGAGPAGSCHGPSVPVGRVSPHAAKWQCRERAVRETLEAQ